MALTVPTTDDLLAHMNVEEWVPAEEEDFAELLLQQATDMMSAATGLTEDPEDALALRIMRTGIVDLAFYLYARSEDREALYSPFSSERIGSYSYQKSQADQRIQSGIPVGAEMFDFAVAYLRGLLEEDNLGEVWYEGECVFTRKASEPALATPGVSDSDILGLYELYSPRKDPA